MFKAVSMRGAGHFVGGILGKFVKLNVFFIHQTEYMYRIVMIR